MKAQQSAHIEFLSRRGESEIRAAVRLLADTVCRLGLTREEALIAISDAADTELADITEGASDGSTLFPDIVPFCGIRH